MVGKMMISPGGVAGPRSLLPMVLLLAAATLAPSRCETRKQFHSRFSSSSSSSAPHHRKQLVATDVVSREAYMKSIPLRVMGCLEHVSLVDCGKLYLLQNMEARSYRFANTGNLTHDVQQLLLPAYRAGDNRLFSDQLLALNGTDVNQRLGRGLRLLLHERIVDLALLPGLAVRLTPSGSNQLEFSVRKDVAVTVVDGDGHEGTARDKAKKGLKAVLQLGVPIVLLPAMLLAGILPMILPVLKFATIFSSIVNHAALAAAIMYLAKQHAAEQESKQTVYFNAGYN